MFSHRSADSSAAFVHIATKSGHALTLTGDHYLYVNGVLATAKTVKIGDIVTSADGSNVRFAHAMT